VAPPGGFSRESLKTWRSIQALASALEGQNLTLAQDKVLKKGLPHFSFQTAPRARDGISGIRERRTLFRPGLAFENGQVTIDFTDGKGRKFKNDSSLNPLIEWLPGKESQRPFRDPDRNDAGKAKGLAPGESVEAVENPSHAKVERLIKTDPGNFRVGKRGGPGKGDQGAPAT